MTTTMGADLAYWEPILRSGGVTTVPRWATAPGSGVGEHLEPVPARSVDIVARLAGELAVAPEAIWLGVHARVLAALSGERDVVTATLCAPRGARLPMALSTDVPTWRRLLHAADRAWTGHLGRAHEPVEELLSFLGLSGPQFETAFDVSGQRVDLPPQVVLSVDWHRAQPTVLRLRHRAEALDGAAAARIAGYHLGALAAAAADLDADPHAGSLLSPAERAHQLFGMAGPHRELPDARFHELFERRVAEHPDAVAAVHGDQRWTYAQLNAHANRLGHALLARGLGAEDVVAVVTERNLDWLACVLAVFKAGGAYLPIEPHFPAERIARTLTRAQVRFALTEPGSDATLREATAASPDTAMLFVRDAYAESRGEDDLGVAVAAGQLAYVYFTSGSTGEPKGAMCEQAGMLNHLFAKIEDLGIDSRSVVAQTAPQCFDISLWQLVSALLVGGRTLLVPQETILDVERFVETIDSHSVTVCQLVPSYLDAVLSYLEGHPRDLPALQFMSVTGEAVKKELTQRWFAAMPNVEMVNAYGLTETCDDTNHEVMTAVPTSTRVPLGPPIANVSVYVVDANLDPVPLGAPGEIVFSGVCVGRGYVNDPERTAAAFLPDPHRPGERLYRSGDQGRWRADGKLEFLGRRDTQVKISGFRIEIGEIENTLLRMPGVGDGAVVVAGSGVGAHLVGFYSGPAPLPIEALREHLAASLPAYMVPRTLHWREGLPLTANGKVDRKTLCALAAELGVLEAPAHAATTATERRVAAAWADVLGIEASKVGRTDSFFDLGGTSLLAVKVVIALNRQISLAELAKSPVLADLGALLDTRPVPASASRDKDA